MAYLPPILIQTGAIIGALAIAYSLPKYILGSSDDIFVQCNSNIQAFELDNVPVYWRVFEGHCNGRDPNFEIVRSNVEDMLSSPELDQSQWPSATCGYAQAKDMGYVWGYGTDYYEVEELDCLQPLRELQAEKESNANIQDVLKEMVVDRSSNLGNMLAGIF